METVGLGFCFEDLPVGRQFKTIGRTRIRVVKQNSTVALTYTPLRMIKCREVADQSPPLTR